jgi:serine/threonine protein kinase
MMTALPSSSRFVLTPDLHPGYRLRRLRGCGGFGEVWEADAPDGTLVALKFLPCPKGQGAPQELRSIRMVRDLPHPQLTQVEKVWCAPGFLVIVMELADGSLADLLEVYQADLGTPLPPDHVCPLLTQAAQALDFLNTQQHLLQGQWATVQHCDVTLPNLLVFGQKVKLSDFGLTTALSFREKAHFRAGTPAYAAPEVFQGRVSDHTDQYALAVCYCLLRSGRPPFPDTPREFVPGYVRPAPDLTMLEAAERPVIARALALIPQDRWPSCGELMAELARVTAPAPAASAPDKVERRQGTRYQAGAAVACVVLATLGNREWQAQVQNLSTGGARLRIAWPGCPLRPGRLLELALSNTARSLEVRVRLQLIYCAEQPSGDYEVGGSFDRPLRPEELDALLRDDST